MNTAPRSATWRTSSFSSNGTNCVELATDGRTWGAVRDSKNRGGDVLMLDAQRFRSLVQVAKNC